MKKIQLITLTLIFLSLGAYLFAGGFALTGVGSRATSMGGAFRGLANDASAMFWNPAGLGFMDENSIDLGGTFILPSGTWDSSGTGFIGSPYGIPGYTAKEYEAEKSLRSFPNAFVTMAKHPKLKYGLGVFVPYGLGTTWDLYNEAAVGITNADFPKDETLSSIAILDIHPSIAYQIMPTLSAGLGVSVMYGAIDIAKLSWNTNAAGDTTYYAKPKTSDMSGTGIGYGLNLGFMFKPTETISVGLSGKIPSEIKMEGDVETFNTAYPAGYEKGKYDIETTLNLPGEIGVGVSYKVIPNMVLNLDYAYTMWDVLDEVVVDITTPAGVMKDKLAFKWENTSRVSLGTEYLMGPNAFRAGFFMDESPIPEETQTPTLSDINTKFSSNLGYGRNFGNITVDANMQYILFSEREIKATSQTTTNMAGRYNTNSLSGNIGIGYKF
ncbi:MAG: outer membrane protein transport protein [Candidatus Cloacimonetes bacterium]|nr:outer membrane protein transport protein [Candidatus Cloacimonadota bacterium]